MKGPAIHFFPLFFSPPSIILSTIWKSLASIFPCSIYATDNLILIPVSSFFFFLTLPFFRRCKIRKRDPFRDPFLKSNETKEYGKHDLFHHRVNSSVYVCVRVCIYVAANWSRAYLMSLTPRPFIARLTTSYAYSPVRSSRLYRLPSLTTMIDDRRLYFDKGFFFFFFSLRGVKM